jgi:uncharacterized membrane protein YeaQ/YmgE (transglycosylase-associated protein family)
MQLQNGNTQAIVLAAAGVLGAIVFAPALIGFLPMIINVVLLLLAWGLAGFIAGRIVRGRSYGLIGNIAMGLLGGFVGSLIVWVLGLGSFFSFPFANIVIGVFGAMLLVFLARLIDGASASR